MSLFPQNNTQNHDSTNTISSTNAHMRSFTSTHATTMFNSNAFADNNNNNHNNMTHAGGDKKLRATTILVVRKDDEVFFIGDGQMSLGPTVVKSDMQKIRVISNGKVIVGFAGGVADAFILLDRLETQLEKFNGELLRASIELVKTWRMDRSMQNLQSQMIAANSETVLLISGEGLVSEIPDHGILSIGSGSPYAQSAALALCDIDGMSAEDIGRKAMKIAADTCVYTNDTHTIEKIGKDGEVESTRLKKEADAKAQEEKKKQKEEYDLKKKAEMQSTEGSDSDSEGKDDK